MAYRHHLDGCNHNCAGFGWRASTTTEPYSGQVVLNNYLPVDTLIPTIPDGALGYEIDAGFDWKLLEGLTARCTMGYWVPGKWFSYACVDKSQANWGNWRWFIEWEQFAAPTG